MAKNWFKYETVVYEKEEGHYMKATSSFFNKFIFSWQRIAAIMYTMGGQWIIETGRRVPETIFEMGKILKALTIIYDEITDILEELIYGCYFDDAESIIETIMTKEYYCIEEHDYCEKLLRLCKTLKINIINFKIFVKK